MKKKVMMLVVFAIVATLLLTLRIVHAQQSTSTYYIEQLEITRKNSTKILTIYIPEGSTNYTLKICNIYGNITIKLSNYSSYAISNIKFITITGQVLPGKAYRYYLREVSLEIPSDVRCIEISLRRTEVSDSTGMIVTGLSQKFILNNNEINITTSVFPPLMIFNRKLGKLLFYKICVLSVAPISIILRPDYFTMIILETHRGTLYEKCYKTYEKNIEVKVEGTAIVNITAYYIIGSGRRIEKLRNVTVTLARRLIKECNNVEICNSTYCGLTVIGREKGIIFLTVNNVAVRAYYLDSVIDGKIVISDSIIPLSSILLVDSSGTPLTCSELGKGVKIILQGPVTLIYGAHTCAVEGYYKAILRIGNITYSLGSVYLMPGTEIRLPFKKLKIHVLLGGLCRNGCKIGVIMCGRSHNYYVTPHNTTFKIAYLEYCKQTPQPVAYYRGRRVPLEYSYYGNILLVNACIAEIVVHVRDMLGFNINALTYVDGKLCEGRCIVTCGDHDISVEAYGVNVTKRIYVNSGVKIINMRIQVLGYKSLIVVMFIVAVIIATVSAAIKPWKARGREKRKRRRVVEEEDVIEIS